MLIKMKRIHDTCKGERGPTDYIPVGPRRSEILGEHTITHKKKLFIFGSTHLSMAKLTVEHCV